MERTTEKKKHKLEIDINTNSKQMKQGEKKTMFYVGPSIRGIQVYTTTEK